MPKPNRPRGRPKTTDVRGSPFAPILGPPPGDWPHSPSIDGTEPDVRIEHIVRVLGTLESGGEMDIEDKALLSSILRGILSINYRSQPDATRGPLARALGLSAGWRDTRPTIKDREDAMLRDYEQLRSWGLDEHEHAAPGPLTGKQAIGYLVDKYRAMAKRGVWCDETVKRTLTRARARRRRGEASK